VQLHLHTRKHFPSYKRKQSSRYLFCCGQGIDVFDPKFNIVSPGADAEVYFPYTQEDKRLKKFHSELKELLYGSPEKGKSVGQLKSKDKPIIFRLEFGSTFSVLVLFILFTFKQMLCTACDAWQLIKLRSA